MPAGFHCLSLRERTSALIHHLLKRRFAFREAGVDARGVSLSPFAPRKDVRVDPPPAQATPWEVSLSPFAPRKDVLSRSERQ